MFPGPTPPINALIIHLSSVHLPYTSMVIARNIIEVIRFMCPVLSTVTMDVETVQPSSDGAASVPQLDAGTQVRERDATSATPAVALQVFPNPDDFLIPAIKAKDVNLALERVSTIVGVVAFACYKKTGWWKVPRLPSR